MEIPTPDYPGMTEEWHQVTMSTDYVLIFRKAGRICSMWPVAHPSVEAKRMAPLVPDLIVHHRRCANRYFKRFETEAVPG